jgi:hypothetical protein
MVNPNRFYTYAYLREDRTPYYIGKGTGKRIYSRIKNINLPKDKSRIIFLKQNLTEQEAFKHEIYMIAVFGRKDLETGILRNRTDGGEGASGYRHNENAKKKMSERMRGNKITLGFKCSEETKRKMSERMIGNNRSKGNIMSKERKEEMSQRMKGNKNTLGFKHSEETKRKMSEIRKGIPNLKLRGRKLSPEHIQKIKDNHPDTSGEKNGMYGKKHSEEHKERVRRKLSKYMYEIITPFNEIVISISLRKFCSDNKLNRNLMRKVAKGEIVDYNGYKVKIINELPN